MRRLLLLLVLSALTLLPAGCGRQVQSTQRFLGVRPGMHSTLHWNLLANEVASRINEELMHQQYLNASVYVRHSCGQSGDCGANGIFGFDEGFNDLLVTQLTRFGIRTMDSPTKAALIVEYKVQIVDHPPERGWVSSTLGVDVLDRNTGEHEIIITTSIIDHGRYVVRSSDIYTIKSIDTWHYRGARDQQAVNIRLTGPRRPSPPVSSQKTAL